MRFFHIEFDGRLFVEQAICGNAGGEVHQEIGLPPVARVFNLADVLQLVVDASIAKTITTIRLKLPINDTVITHIMMLTSEQRSIKLLFDHLGI